jgi:hypothetical protein
MEMNREEQKPLGHNWEDTKVKNSDYWTVANILRKAIAPGNQQ